MIRLGDVAIGRDNNFTLIRFIAASAVLVSHAWPIALGDGTPEPLSATGQSLGSLAVYVFFAVSGFFITASFAQSRSARAFALARALRLFPCLAVSLLLAALVMGPLVTTLPAGEYLTHPQTASFLWRNLTLAFPQFTLPGVFETNPYPAVAGSIWTLIHEVLCYGLVFLVGITGILWRRSWMIAAMMAYFALWFLSHAQDWPLPGKVEQLRRLSFPFVVGMSFYAIRAWLPLSFAGVGLTAAAAWALHGTTAGFAALSLAIAYGTFWLAYVPHGRIRAFNHFGDYSYGIYVYAFPLQGLVVWLWGPMDPWTNIALSFPLTLLFSVLSWHWIEAPALALRKRFERTSRPALP